MPTLLRLVRFVSWSLAFCLILAGPVLAVASPRSFQEEEPSPSPSTEPTPSDPVGGHELEVTVAADPATVTAGEDIVFSLVITNTGTVAAKNIVVESHVPKFLKVDSVLADPNKVTSHTDSETNVVTLEYASQEPGSTMTLGIQTNALRESSSNEEENTLSVVVTANGNTDDPTNNTADVVVMVLPASTATPTPTSPSEPTPTSPTSPYPGPGTPTATPTATSVPGVPSPTPTTPGGSPPPAGTPTPTPTADPSTPQPTATPVLDPVAPPSDKAQLKLAVSVEPASIKVDDYVLINVTTTNVGEGVAGSFRVTNIVPENLILVDAAAGRHDGQIFPQDDQAWVVVYEELGSQQQVTTQFLAYALKASGKQGDPANFNQTLASIDKRDQVDDSANVEIWVAPSSAQPRSGQPSQPGTTPGGGTTDPTPTPVPPSKLPDTGAPSDGMLLVVAAGGLLIAGAGAHLMLRRRSARL